MPEKYTGPKFNCSLTRIKIAKGSNLKAILALIRAISSMCRLAKVGANEGNQSIRVPDGFVIKCAGASFFTQKPADFTLVNGFSQKGFSILARGPKPPSSESLMHALIYKKRKDAKCILHIHHKRLLENASALGIKTTKKEFPYGSRQLAKAAASSLRSADILALKNHGIISVASSPKAAVSLLKRLLHSLQSLPNPRHRLR